jgi:sugar phosphate permease
LQHHSRRKLIAEFASRAVFRQATRQQRDRDQEDNVSTIGRQLDSKSRETWVLALASVGSLMVALDALVVTTALSTIRLDLGASIEQLEWTVNAYTLSFSVLLMTGAALGDRFGRRRLFSVGLALFAAASAACAVAPDVGWLIAARGFQGTGGRWCCRSRSRC